jgi:hypothetical protein
MKTPPASWFFMVEWQLEREVDSIDLALIEKFE